MSVDAGSPLRPPPADLGRPGAYRFGRFDAPVPDPRLEARALERFRLKEWHYVSFTHPRWFVAMAVVQLGYVANCFAYVVDRRHPRRRHELEVLSPLGRALRMAPSSIRGQSLWQRPGERLALRYDAGFAIDVDLPLGESRLRGSARIRPGPSLALSFPLAPDRPAYTHKAAGLLASGQLRLDAETIDLDGALATLDWTRSLADRETRWNWCALAHRLPDGRLLGLNLSDHVYVDATGASPESFYRLGDRVVPVGAVTFSVPPDPARGAWRIASRDDEAVDLAFTPVGARSQDLDLRVIRSSFVQPYGHFEGRVGEVTVDDGFGVVEDHHALW